MSPAEAPLRRPASLIVIDPQGRRTRVAIEPLPFRIGRAAENHFVVRDSRVSRMHARIVADGNEYALEDCQSLHGTYVNGKRIREARLRNSDHIDFGFPDSYQFIFAADGNELKQLMEQLTVPENSPGPRRPGNMAKLRAILDVARALQNSLAVDDVLASLVDAALAITGAERGFLLLRSASGGLDIRIARRHDGRVLQKDDLRVPRAAIERALQQRRDLLFLHFDPSGLGARAQDRMASPELRNVICVPLVRIRTGVADATNVLTAVNETVGVLYMDSSGGAADLAGGNRELLQTLAIEASTIIENARLLEGERVKQQMEEELRLARSIQQNLLPRGLPEQGWIRAAGSSIASHLVGGDYFDVRAVSPRCWLTVVADISGKGVSSALLASLLQGALITATDDAGHLTGQLERLSRFLYERTNGEKYATIFYALLDDRGRLSYVNAAHCPPLIARGGRQLISLDATSMPVGLLDTAQFTLAEQWLQPGDKIVVYSDGLTDARNAAGEFFGKRRLRDLILAHSADSCTAIHDAIHDAVAAFTGGALQSDDITVVVVEFCGTETTGEARAPAKFTRS